MNPIPCYRAAHLLHYCDFLSEIGAPLDQRLSKAGLPTMMGHDADLYLPQLPTLKFLQDTVRQEGIDELSLRALAKLQISDLGEEFVFRALSAPSLKVALECFRNLVSIEDPYVEFWISHQESIVKLCIINHFRLSSEDLYFEDWHEMLVLIAIVRAFAGPSWQPEEIAFRSSMRPTNYASEFFPNTRFITCQHAASVTIPHHMLSLAPYASHNSSKSHDKLLNGLAYTDGFQSNFIGSLKAILSSYEPDRLPTIEELAEMTVISVRTLQRRLKQYGFSYTDLISEFRFETACRLLRETDASGLEIALEIGYQDPSHFSRAFKRIYSISPSEYRHLHQRSYL